MSLGQYAYAVGRLGSVDWHRRRILKQVAFLGRYGHQPANVVLHMPMQDVIAMADAVAELLDEEAEALKKAQERR